jgi:hypothetical protein
MDYANGKIYKIVCNITGEVYVGSSTTTLAKRLYLHTKKKNTCSSKQIIDRGDYVIVLIEAFPCANKSELFQRERYHYDLIPNINKQRPFTTEEERIEENSTRCKAYREANKEATRQYKLDNKEKIAEWNKQYDLDNKEKKKQYELDNKEKISERKKQYYLDNKEKISEQHKQNYLDSRERILEKQKQYDLDNKEKKKQYRKQYYLEKKKMK